MSHTTHLIETYASAQRLSTSYVGRLVANDGKLYARLQSGGDTTARNATRIIQWFSDNWPLDLPWPTDIPRPDPSPDATAPATPSGSRATPSKADIEQQVTAIMADIDRAFLVLRGALEGDRLSIQQINELQGRAVALAGTLGEGGKIISRAALCTALQVNPATYDKIVSVYQDKPGRPVPLPPKPGTKGRAILDALAAAGDVRFEGRRAAVGWRDAKMRGAA